jgi:iron complex outermembrane recepter protein
MKRKWIVLFLLILGLWFVLGGLSSALAQGSSNEEFTLEEITVTAQKRAENSQRVAIQMDVISGDYLTEQNVTTLADALSGVAEAFVQEAAKDFQVVIRGMTNNNNPGDSVNQVGVAIDGSYSSNFMSGQSGFYDMQRVEVLSGPQGTLYSRNSSGGIVNMISNDPSTKALAGSAMIGMGNYNSVNAQAMINVPFDDKFAFRAAFNVSAHDGYLNNGTMDDDTKSTRFKLGYTPSEKLSAVLTFEYTKIGGLSKFGFVIPFEVEDDVEDPWTSIIPGSVYRADRMSKRLYLNLNWETPLGVVTLLPSLSKYQEHNRQQDPLNIGRDGQPITGGGPPGAGTTVGWRSQIRNHRQEEQSFEARIASPDDFFMKYLLGVYFYKMKWTNDWTKDETELNGMTWPYVEAWSIQENPSNSVFGNVTVPVAERFRVTAGGRYTKDKETRTGYDSTGGFTGKIFNFSSGPFENDHFDYKLAAEYDLASNAMVWADYSTGYKMGFQGRPAQTVDSYQIGEKSRLFDNKLQLNATVWYYDYQNFQLSAGSMVVGSTEYQGSGYGKADLYGLDLSTEYILTPQDSINLSVAYLHATISSATIIYSTMSGEQLPPVEMTSGLPPLNGAPEFTITASYQHIFNLSSGGNITARIDPRYVTEKTLQFQPSKMGIPPGLDVNKLNTEPAHLMLDASLSYYDASGKWSLNGYVKNITNHAEKTGFYMGVNYLQIGPPLTFGGTMTVNF